MSKGTKVLAAVTSIALAVLMISTTVMTAVLVVRQKKMDTVISAYMGNVEDPAQEDDVVIAQHYTIQSTTQISDAYKGEHFVHVPVKYDDGLSLRTGVCPVGCGRSRFLSALAYGGDIFSAALFIGNECVAGSSAPCAYVLCKAGVGGGHFQQLAVIHAAHCLEYLHDRTRTLHSAAVEGYFIDRSALIAHGGFILSVRDNNRRVVGRFGVGMRRFVEPRTARINLHAAEAVLHEYSGGVVRPDTHGAEYDDFFGAVELSESGSKSSQRNIDRTGNGVGHDLRFLAHVEKWLSVF